MRTSTTTTTQPTAPESVGPRLALAAFATLIPLALLACDSRNERPAGVSPLVAARPSAQVTAARASGKALFFGRAGCVECHAAGLDGTATRGPNLGAGGGQREPVALRAGTRRPDLGAIEYVVESMIDPDADAAPGYYAGVMRAPD
ncbi:MAG: hypothetical protein EXR73_03885, partial [Myxococcales bacterium]|nr:hypothetical protein [Myxococcales bacterium]